ncbi:MAG: 4-(cytidine 5'-diphospho)-2-C-methyl-D-erythritol kinase [Acidisphaera sp.]|nr:4-(cytidine 5'-diphospho)-2-C-methyl-D-erythritol kinase [Acidisphaera sp.]
MPIAPCRCEAAPAKVNLFLHVTGRRADRYHLLDSLVVFAGAGDVLHAAPDERLRLRTTGPFAGALPAGPANLALRAAEALASRAGIAPRVRLTLDKRLPVASGVGGGSADAAAVLRLLARLWEPEAAGADLPGIAATLGADVPVCLAGRPARMRGVGERLDPAPALPEFGLALVNPGVALPTAAVFAARRGGFSPEASLPAAWADAASLAAGLADLRNDLEPPAIRLCPAVAEVLECLRALPGCLLARMSGSGATCFGLFATPAAAVAGAAALARPGWWSWGGAPAPALGCR